MLGKQCSTPQKAIRDVNTAHGNNRLAASLLGACFCSTRRLYLAQHGEAFSQGVRLQLLSIVRLSRKASIAQHGKAFSQGLYCSAGEALIT